MTMRRHKQHKGMGGKEVIAVDADYTPMMVLPRRHGLKALCSGRALVLDPETWTTYSIEDIDKWPALQIIVYPHTKAFNKARLNAGSGGVLKRDEYMCQYEGCDNKGTTVDHVIPRSRGGKTCWENLVACCHSCNSKKADKTLAESGMRLKRTIRSPKWILYEKFNALCASWSTRHD